MPLKKQNSSRNLSRSEDYVATAAKLKKTKMNLLFNRNFFFYFCEFYKNDLLCACACVTLMWTARTDIWDGYVAFVVSILLIGALTAVIGDLSSHLGCTVGLKDTVTAIAFVALGTSIPGKARPRELRDKANNNNNNITAILDTHPLTNQIKSDSQLDDSILIRCQKLRRPATTTGNLIDYLRNVHYVCLVVFNETNIIMIYVIHNCVYLLYVCNLKKRSH